ncbi:MAG: hypothetical protein Q4E88_04735 [Coriobacteriia bacterium]|nr:hypothetical protein [Coriobacteriia bacterium]
MKSKSRKNFIWNMFGSTIYAFTSLFYMIIVTRINGVDNAGIFTFAFSFVCIIQVIGTYAGRTFQVTERNKKIKDCDFLYFRIINCFLMIIVTTIFILCKNYSLDKNIIIFILLLYRTIDAYSETIYGIFQKNDNLFQVGISLTLRSILCVFGFLVVDLFSSNLILSVFAVLFIDILVFIFYDILKLKKYNVVLDKFNRKNIKFLAISGFSVFIFSFLVQFIVNAPKFAIDDLSTESAQAIFGIVLMPATLITLCSQLLIQSFVYRINESLKKQKYSLYKSYVYKIILYVMILGILALLLAYFFGIPVLNIIYGIDLKEYLITLLIIIGGSILNGIVLVLSNSLIAIRKNWTQVIIYGISTVLIFVLSFSLVGAYEINGGALAYFITNFLMVIAYFILFIFETRKLR